MKYINLILILLAICLFSCSKQSAAPGPALLPLPAANGVPVVVTVNQAQPGKAVPATFEGLSYETGILASSANFLSAGNTVLLQLIKNLGPGILRVGGNSSDETFWTGHARTAKTGTDSLTTTDIDNFSAFAKATGWQVLFGLNLGNYNAATTANEALYVKNSLGTSLYAFQNGNEPDLFYNNGIRTSAYTYASYQNEWGNYFAAVRNVIPQAPFAGPDVADNTTWVTSFAANENANVILIDGHYYNTGPATDASITYQTILAPNTKLPAYLQALNTTASAYHLPYRVSECNSVYDGGKTGVSDVFASALWALDYMWTVAENNGQGINFHGGSSGAYSPIVLNGTVTAPRPEYYAMLAFKYGSSGAALVPATVAATTYNCTAYACVNGGITYITLINKDTNNIAYTVQLSNTPATVQAAYLTAPTITSATGITLAGNSVNADGTFTVGSLPQYGVSQKSFVINVPAGSAAIVTVQ